MTQKIISKYGDYNQAFQKALETRPHKKTIISFMWLAALSDLKTETTETEKQLLEIITSEPDIYLKENLKSSYFKYPQEPDTVNLIKIISSKHPEFKKYIEKLKIQTPPLSKKTARVAFQSNGLQENRVPLPVTPMTSVSETFFISYIPPLSNPTRCT